jgi:hypothetical protein
MCVDVTELALVKKERSEAREAYRRAKDESVTFSSIIQALSGDYLRLYRVDLDTGHFIEYIPDAANGKLKVFRETNHFEDEAKITAEQLVAAEDRELFISSMKPEAILKKLEEKQNADLVIRLLMADGSVKHASVRVSPISEEGYDVVIGVRDIEEQIQNREDSERMERERVSFRRMSALAGNYLAIYTVDPVTDHFSRYSAAEEYADLLAESEGEKFFEQSQRNAVRVICPEDLPLFRKEFTK